MAGQISAQRQAILTAQPDSKLLRFANRHFGVVCTGAQKSCDNVYPVRNRVRNRQDLLCHATATNGDAARGCTFHELHMGLNCRHLQDLYRLLSSCIAPEMVSLPHPGLSDALDSNEQGGALLLDKQQVSLDDGGQPAQSSQALYGKYSAC